MSQDRAIASLLQRTRPDATGDAYAPRPLERPPVAAVEIGRVVLKYVTQAGGAAGGGGVDCTWTYTVKELNDSTTARLNSDGDPATAMTPEYARIAGLPYDYAGQSLGGSPETFLSRLALCERSPDGVLHLLLPLGERPNLSDCCGGPAPCACPIPLDDTGGGEAPFWPDLVSGAAWYAHGSVRIYSIQGYTDAFFTACDTCVDGGSGVWDGRFTAGANPSPGETCHWTGSYPLGERTFNGGHKLRKAELWLDAANCQWVVTIECTDADGYVVVVWLGTKATGNSPFGLYTKTSGCSGPANLVVKEG